MNRTVAAIVMGLIVSSASWAHFNECVRASSLYCSKNTCKKHPNIWCLKAKNQKKAQNYNEKLASKVKVKAKTKAVQTNDVFRADKAPRTAWKGKFAAEKS